MGPKAALAILSVGGPKNFTLAVMTGDEKLLTAAQGVGKKIAQRIILELKDKIGGTDMELDFSGIKPAAPAAANTTALASAALQELGYSAAEVAAEEPGDATAEVVEEAAEAEATEEAAAEEPAAEEPAEEKAE